MDNAEIIQRIQELKAERKAVILAHNYQIPEVQDIADFTGDSLELSRIAAKTDCETIVFCGVRFMAETAAILSPEKTVILPEPHAGCPLADMVDVEHLIELKIQHPDAVTVCYINSSAEVKAKSDVCCTSANAVKVVQGLNGAPEILFVPCRHLGDYVARMTGKPIILARGFCPTHQHIIAGDIAAMKEKYPDAEVIVHPECRREVLLLADHVTSTSGMLRAVAESKARRFIIGTEEGLLHRLKKDFPDREFFVPTAKCICPNMKKITLEKVMWAMETMENRVVVPEPVRTQALGSLERMLQYA